MKKLMAGLVMVTALAAFAPQPLAAEGGCTEGYTECLNDTWYMGGWLQVLADIECFADYSACIAEKFFG